jgi:integrase
MKAVIGNALLSQLKPQSKEIDIWDTKLTGFILRVKPNGKMIYRCEYARGKRITIGSVGVLTPMQARDRAKEILADAVRGVEPKKKNTTFNTLKIFIENEYYQWVKTHKKRGDETIIRIKKHFFNMFGAKQLSEITPILVEKWRSKRLGDGIKPVTLNRDIATIKGALSKAVEWGFIDSSPLAKLKPLKVDAISKVRFLDKAEESRLREVIDVREQKLRISRESSNEWRQKRNYELKPSFINLSFVDYMKPMILLSINTGLRRGELLNLAWENINLSLGTLTIIGEHAKSGKTRHVPLNQEALNTLKNWLEQSGIKTGLVFRNKDGNGLTDKEGMGWNSKECQNFKFSMA